MKILHVIDTLDLGGAERVCFTMLHLYANTSDVVALVELKKLGPLTPKLPKSVKTFSFERKKRFHPRHLFRLAKVLKHYDVIHVQQRKPLKEVLVASLLFGGKHVIVLHDHFGNIKLNTRKELFISWFKNRFEYVGVNEQLVSWARNVLKIEARQTHLIPNIIVKDFDWVYTKKPDSRKLSIVLVSNFRPVKNIEFAINLVRYLVEEKMEVNLTIIGQPVNPQYHQKIVELIDTLQMGQYVSLITDCDNVQGKLNEYDFAIHTSRSEAHPLVLLEFSAYGLPFIAYNSCELTSELGEELPLIAIDNFDFQKWKIRIERLLPDLTEISIALRSHFEQNYSSEPYIAKWNSLYRSAYSEKFHRSL